VATIGSYRDDYHVTTERFQHRRGEVRLELWRNNGTSWSSTVQTWIECVEGDAAGDAAVERAAHELIARARGEVGR
jgi:hypothetical protein